MLLKALYFLVLVGAFHGVTAGVNSTNPTHNSTNSACKGHMPGCRKLIRVSWNERRPYVYQVGNETRGILPDVVNLLLNECCGSKNLSCWQIDQDKPVRDVTTLLFRGSSANAVILYPVIVDLQSHTNNMIGIVPPTDIAFLVPKAKGKSFPMKLLTSVFDAWPVLILTFLLSILAGIILWVTEIRVNPDEFPRTFIRGSWEGFWWAFVSMTTVGYGDRSPRSFLGRAFAVCWILIGICIVSIFTATLTTALTTISMDTKKTITGSKIGVLGRSIELSIAIQHQSDINVFSTIEDVKKALDDKHIEGALLNKYIIHHYKHLFPDTHFKIDEVISQGQISYGAVINDSQLNECFQQVLQHDRFIVYKIIRESLKRTMKSSSANQAVKNSQSIFDPTGDLFYPSLYSCVILVLVIVVVGIIAEIFYLKPMSCITQRAQCYTVNGDIEMSNMNVEKLEKEMMSEIRNIVKKYQDKIKEAENKGNESLPSFKEKVDTAEHL